MKFLASLCESESGLDTCWQHKTELDVNKWFVDCDTLGVVKEVKEVVIANFTMFYNTHKTSHRPLTSAEAKFGNKCLILQ